MTLLMNHINSVKRPGLGNKSPYELVEEDDEDFKALMSLFNYSMIFEFEHPLLGLYLTSEQNFDY